MGRRAHTTADVARQVAIVLAAQHQLHQPAVRIAHIGRLGAQILRRYMHTTYDDMNMVLYLPSVVRPGPTTAS